MAVGKQEAASGGSWDSLIAKHEYGVDGGQRSA